MGEGPNWFLSMDQFLEIVNKVVRSKDSMFTGRNLHETGHPEDMMVIVMDITETVASTIVVLGQVKNHMFEAPTQ